MARRKIVNPTEVSKKKLASKTKYTCPDCGLNAWAKPDSNLVCDDCQSAMTSIERKELARGGTVQQEDVELFKIERLSDLTVKARDAILAEKKAVKKRKAKRLESGQHLLDLKTMIDSDPELLIKHNSWGEWLGYTMGEFCSRKDAEKRMALAGALVPLSLNDRHAQ